MALPGMIYEQLSDHGKALSHITPLGWVNLSSTGLLSYAAQMLKTFALQISKGIGVLTMR